jgi:hypothetical protein
LTAVNKMADRRDGIHARRREECGDPQLVIAPEQMPQSVRVDCRCKQRRIEQCAGTCDTRIQWSRNIHYGRMLVGTAISGRQRPSKTELTAKLVVRPPFVTVIQYIGCNTIPHKRRRQVPCPIQGRAVQMSYCRSTLHTHFNVIHSSLKATAGL